MKSPTTVRRSLTTDHLLVREGYYSVKAVSATPAAMVDAMSRTLADFSRELTNGTGGLARPKRPEVD